MYTFKDGVYSDVLITSTINVTVCINDLGRVVEKEHKEKNARIRCYNGVKWVDTTIEDIEEINDCLKVLEKKLEPCGDLFSDRYVEQQIENKRIYTVYNKRKRYNKEVAKKLIVKIYSKVKENKKLSELEVCFMSIREQKTFVNSCGSEKRYTYNADGIIIAYTINKSGYQGMIRLYDVLSYDYTSIIKRIFDQINKDVLYADTENSLLSGKYTCIMAPGVTGILVHECLGHMSESDVADKNWILGKKIGKSFLNVVDDGKIAGSGYVPFDDEGIDAEETYIVKNGFINGFLSDISNSILRESKSTGNGRIKSNYDKPLVRMTNTYMQGGDWTLDDLFRDVEQGIYIDECLGATIDEKIHIKLGKTYEIKNGKIDRPVKLLEVTGDAFELVNNIEMASNLVDLYNDVFGGCGKKNQTPIRVSYGGPYLKINNVEIVGENCNVDEK